MGDAGEKRSGFRVIFDLLKRWLGPKPAAPGECGVGRRGVVARLWRRLRTIRFAPFRRGDDLHTRCHPERAVVPHEGPVQPALCA